ncbi:MAG: DUF1553 domain-containing protein [Planctomycetota bacterium]
MVCRRTCSVRFLVESARLAFVDWRAGTVIFPRVLSAIFSFVVFVSLPACPCPAADPPPPRFADEIAPLLKNRCVKCHGPALREGGLSLATAAGVRLGGRSGPPVAPHDVAASHLWQRVSSDEMPPDDPLPPAEKALIRRWIAAGAPGLAPNATATPTAEFVDADHWSFRPLVRPELPAVRDASRVRNPIDRFIQSALEREGLGLLEPAPPHVLARRLHYVLTGLPPSDLGDRAAYSGSRALADGETSNGGTANGGTANEHFADFGPLIERLLASPQYGPWWAKFWLDAAGYADSNGYFNADTDRPLAYRYRDYVVRSWNADRPLDVFIREQLAGDELARFRGDSPEFLTDIERLEATHFLRNGQDGSGESDGNPDEVRADRYYALESCQQIVAGALLGLTLQCAKCHDHKFEPLSQRDYYRLQAIFYPAFPIGNWVKPNDRFVIAALPGELEAWQSRLRELEQRLADAGSALRSWQSMNRPRGEPLFVDHFDADAGPLDQRWSATAPGDNRPGCAVPVKVFAATSPAAANPATANSPTEPVAGPGARGRNGVLEIIEGGGAGNRWLSTQSRFDWTPDIEGESIQATFDLVDNRVDGKGAPAERVGYYLALHDYHDDSPLAGGNILVDGHPSAATAVVVDYPGSDARAVGQIGGVGYQPGRNFGVRVTNAGGGRYLLEHLVDGFPDGKPLTLTAADLPDGGFGFEYCCGRSFVVDNVAIERMKAPPHDTAVPAKNASADRGAALRAAVDEARQARDRLANAKPGKIAWQTDVSPTPPPVHLLTRGNYATPGELVEPGPPRVLADPDNPFTIRTSANQGNSQPNRNAAKADGGQRGDNGQKDSSLEAAPRPTTGRRLAFAEWLTKPGSRPAALVARVQVNRLWQHCFGMGLATSVDNLGLSGSTPSHPELLDWLAAELIDSGWSVKHVQRLLLQSAVFQQSSRVSAEAQQRDPANRLCSRFAPRRLEAEAIRDSMLAASGELDTRLGGPYVPTARNSDGEVLPDESNAGARRRSLYLYQRRTQLVSLLTLFDAPSIVFHSTQRPRSATPLQSLALWNSPFAIRRAESAASTAARDIATAPKNKGDGIVATRKLDNLYARVLGRAPAEQERQQALAFVASQAIALGGGAGESSNKQEEARERAWRDLAQALMASNEFLYLE